MSKSRSAEEIAEPNYSGIVDFTSKKTQAASTNKQLLDLLRWEKRELSGAVLGCGLLFFYLTTFGGYSYLALASMLILIHILVSAGLNLYTLYTSGAKPESPKKPWHIDAEQAKKFADFATTELNNLADWYGELLSGQNLVAVAQVVGVLFSTWTLGTWFSDVTLLFLGFVGAFSLPLVYEKHNKEINDQIGKLKTLVEKNIENLRSRIPRAPSATAAAGAGGSGGTSSHGKQN